MSRKTPTTKHRTAGPPTPSSLLAVDLLEEPLLQFGDGGTSSDPKEGILLHGPYAVSERGRHPSELSVGIIGADTAIQNVSSWLRRSRDPIAAKEEDPLLHPAFPGFSKQSSFQSEVIEHEDWRARLSSHEIDKIVGQTDARARFDYAVNLVVEKIHYLADRDAPPRVILVALPKEIIDRCWSVQGGTAPAPASPFERKILRRRRSKEIEQQLKLFENFEKIEPAIKEQLVSRNFRRALKARAMKFNVPIQLMQPSAYEDGSSRQPSCTVAWNLFVALYYKGGGFPWILDSFDSGECFVGVSFHRHVSEVRAGMYSSLAQVFSNRSEGVVLRGDKFQWDEKKLGRSPHLTREDAAKLARKVVAGYELYHQRKPSRVIVHKTSSYWPDELAGFKEGLADVADFDLVSLSQRATRLFREGDYPPLRGTHACIANDLHILYTMGYIPFLRGYPRGYVPDPIAVTDHHGQSSPGRICRELMALTKMNWNCADFATGMPITLRFARQVGEIMSELDEGVEPKASFKFYM
jgi:hypothetical protein